MQETFFELNKTEKQFQSEITSWIDIQRLHFQILIDKPDIKMFSNINEDMT